MTYVIPQVRTNYGTFNIRFQGAKVWNDISDDIKLLPLTIFEKNLKLTLLEKYLLFFKASVVFYSDIPSFFDLVCIVCLCCA